MQLVEAESPVTGVVWQVRTTVGAAVAAGDVLLVVESMKMEIPVESPVAGTVAELLVTEGDAVGEDAVVARIDPA
jgi:biotin carboxyl carrier protein